MRKRTVGNELVILNKGFLLKEVFKDNYEYEEYFQLISSVELNEYFPSEFDIEFEAGGKAPRLKYPKNRPDFVILVLPVSRKSGSPKKRGELRKKAIAEYSGLIPKIRLEMKDELTMRKRLLVPDSERKIIDKHIENKRRQGLRKLKTRDKSSSRN